MSEKLSKNKAKKAGELLARCFDLLTMRHCLLGWLSMSGEKLIGRCFSKFPQSLRKFPVPLTQKHPLLGG